MFNRTQRGNPCRATTGDITDRWEHESGEAVQIFASEEGFTVFDTYFEKARGSYETHTLAHRKALDVKRRIGGTVSP